MKCLSWPTDCRKSTVNWPRQGATGLAAKSLVALNIEKEILKQKENVHYCLGTSHLL